MKYKNFQKKLGKKKKEEKPHNTFPGFVFLVGKMKSKIIFIK